MKCFVYDPLFCAKNCEDVLHKCTYFDGEWLYCFDLRDGQCKFQMENQVLVQQRIKNYEKRARAFEKWKSEAHNLSHNYHNTKSSLERNQEQVASYRKRIEKEKRQMKVLEKKWSERKSLLYKFAKNMIIETEEELKKKIESERRKLYLQLKKEFGDD